MKQSRSLQLCASIVALAALAACGGSDGPIRGSLRENPATLTTLSAAQIDAATAQLGLQALTGKAACDVSVVGLNYDTVGPAEQASNVSGVLLLPTGACRAPAALVAYGKGTDVQKPRTLANPQDGETLLLAAMYAAQGYAVVAPDYLGYARSGFGYHPYLHADSEATTLIDAIRAARQAAGLLSAPLSGKVFLTGYSQGGHVSMATHRAIERDLQGEITVTGGAHLAGPYNLTGALQQTQAIAGYQVFMPFIVTSWQKVYGNLYSPASQAFKAPYDSYIDNLLPSATLDRTTLITTGKLPGAAGETPNQARDAMFQSSYLANAQSNPAHPLAVAAQKNTLLGWTPKSALMLCGGAGDPTVPPAVHQAPMKADLASRGVTVMSVDVDPQIQAIFGPAPTDPASAAFANYYGNYHAGYEFPLCHAAARSFFSQILQAKP